MPQSCVTFGCSNHSSKGSGIRFFQFPDPVKEKNRHAQWVRAMKRKNYVWKQDHRVCFDHFTRGRPWPTPGDIDYVPHVRIGTEQHISKE